MRAALLLAGAGLVAGGASALWIRSRYLVATVDGRSMEPTLRAGDRLLVRRTGRVRVGQIVVVKAPDPPLVHVAPGTPLTAEEEAALAAGPQAAPRAPEPGRRLLVKRAVAIPGDRVPREGFPALCEVPETVVPPRSLVVLGDNPAASWDSREYGFVRSGELVGVAIRRLRV